MEIEQKKDNRIYVGDNLEILKAMPDKSVDLVYIDPPFNTNKIQTRTYSKSIRSSTEGNKGYQGKQYKKEAIVTREFSDSFDDFMLFLKPRLEEAHRILKDNGSMYFHIDYREVHYCKVMIDGIFGRDNFLNEIIWSYDYGARSKTRWSAKHDNILFYVKNNKDYIWNFDTMDRIPYLAPSLVGPVKAALGKTPTDSWWHTIVATNGKEKMGYPTQKPLGIIRRIIKASSPKDGIVLDFFAGSGTTGEAALLENRKFILIDQNPQAIEVMKKRFVNSMNSIELIDKVY